MFEKLLSLIPYNPGLLPQMAFYSRRMREEASIRRTGTIFIVLAFMLQFFAVLSPPGTSVAGTPNDIINGGVSSAADARAKCINDTQGFQRILHYYGISCSAFDRADKDVVNKNQYDYFSMGRNSADCTNIRVNIPGEGNNVFWRNMQSCWKTKTTWDAIHIQSQSGRNFWILYDCGNLVSRGLPNPNPLVVNTPIQSKPAPAPVVTPTWTTKPTPVTPTPTTPTPTTPTPPTPEVPCEKTLSSSNKDACVQVRKTATNDTTGIADANDTTANAGDVITYTLFAQNTGKKTVKDFVFEENLNDVLDYAEITNLHGGKFLNGDVTWPAIDIKADESRSVQITVKVKDPIPQTPSTPSDPYHFDLVMTNVYGNAINIKLPGAPAKQVEVVTSTLPNTGPGETLMVAAVIVIMAGYFYSRANLLARESEIAIKESSVV